MRYNQPTELTHQELEHENHSPYYDEAVGFPATPKDELIPWWKFNMNITSDEVDATYVLEEIIDKHSEKWVDLRPYMIENPIKVSIYCKCTEVLELFR